MIRDDFLQELRRLLDTAWEKEDLGPVADALELMGRTLGLFHDNIHYTLKVDGAGKDLGHITLLPFTKSPN